MAHLVTSLLNEGLQAHSDGVPEALVMGVPGRGAGRSKDQSMSTGAVRWRHHRCPALFSRLSTVVAHVRTIHIIKAARELLIGGQLLRLAG